MSESENFSDLDMLTETTRVLIDDFRKSDLCLNSDSSSVSVEAEVGIQELSSVT